MKYKQPLIAVAVLIVFVAFTAYQVDRPLAGYMRDCSGVICIR